LINFMRSGLDVRRVGARTLRLVTSSKPEDRYRYFRGTRVVLPIILIRTVVRMACSRLVKTHPASAPSETRTLSKRKNKKKKW